MAQGRLVRMVTGAVVAGMLASTMPAPVSARVVTTEEALSATPASDRAALDDQQVRELAARLDQMPAGAGVLGVIFAIFVILLVTDILGLTKVFPFTRSVR